METLCFPSAVDGFMFSKLSRNIFSSQNEDISNVSKDRREETKTPERNCFTHFPEVLKSENPECRKRLPSVESDTLSSDVVCSGVKRELNSSPSDAKKIRLDNNVHSYPTNQHGTKDHNSVKSEQNLESMGTSCPNVMIKMNKDSDLKTIDDSEKVQIGMSDDGDCNGEQIVDVDDVVSTDDLNNQGNTENRDVNNSPTSCYVDIEADTPVSSPLNLTTNETEVASQCSNPSGNPGRREKYENENIKPKTTKPSLISKCQSSVQAKRIKFSIDAILRPDFGSSQPLSSDPGTQSPPTPPSTSTTTSPSRPPFHSSTNSAFTAVDLRTRSRSTSASSPTPSVSSSSPSSPTSSPKPPPSSSSPPSSNFQAEMSSPLHPQDKLLSHSANLPYNALAYTSPAAALFLSPHRDLEKIMSRHFSIFDQTKLSPEALNSLPFLYSSPSPGAAQTITPEQQFILSQREHFRNLYQAALNGTNPGQVPHQLHNNNSFYNSPVLDRKNPLAAFAYQTSNTKPKHHVSGHMNNDDRSFNSMKNESMSPYKLATPLENPKSNTLSLANCLDKLSSPLKRLSECLNNELKPDPKLSIGLEAKVLNSKIDTSKPTSLHSPPLPQQQKQQQHQQQQQRQESPKKESCPEKPQVKSEPEGQSSNPLWPAWVFCTRYSDRPSSGPRSRKPKRSKVQDEKRPRTAFTNDQLQRLKREFEDCRYLTETRRKHLADELGLTESQIKIWFQNKRAKIKKSTGVRNPLAMKLMEQGLYNHATMKTSDDSS